MRGCEDLFEAFKVGLGLLYISDLKDMSPYRRKQLKYLIPCEDFDVYPLEQWNEMIWYLTGKPNPQPSIEDAKKVLIEYAKT